MIEVRSVQHPETRNFETELPSLIDAIGRPNFSKRLFSAAQKITNCHTVTSFAFSDLHSPRLLIAENVGEAPVSRHIAEKYMSDYWRYDPVNHVNVDVEGDPVCKAIMINANDIEHTSYRQHCYAAVNLDNRMTIMRSVNGNVVRVNFYRGRETGGPKGGIEAVMAVGEMFIALLTRHDAWCATSHAGHEFQYMERLRQACPELPKRELEVCALITQGFSSEAIALKLGISFNTVLTFRRRAYARLRISSQNELMRLIMA